MQLCNATLHLAGDRNFAVPKQDVSVAEIVLWRLIHGNDAVVDISPTRTNTDSLRKERDRLLATYGQGKKDSIALIDGMFRNVAVQGLTKLRDLRLDEGATPTRKSDAAGLTAADIPDDPTDAED